MTCIQNYKDGAEILADYCAGKLDAARTLEFKTHLTECSECRNLAEAQNTVWEMLDRWKPVEPSPDFDARLYARIARERAEPAWRQWWRRIFEPATPHMFSKPLAPLATAAIVLSLVGIARLPEWYEHGPSPISAAQPQIRVDKIDVDQVEQALEDLDMLTPVAQSSSKPL